MKQNLQKVAVVITAMLFTLFTSCEKDDSITSDNAINQDETGASKILKGKDAASAIAMYYDQIAKSKLSSNGMMLKADDTFVLDETEVLMVKTQE
ncbi:hypothetical protein E0W68_11485 [Flavobacterium salilacus subsp. salilacus]|uniref:hypothetical protein n=1 Tax=Flavobacterium TaxID=237 RepID=UPI0010758AC6|nr:MULTISPECIES: hypothetical protein [Flavobacterium]KAF2516830.1 hypothetical protein E0W68_11485 [Flavobacterium salilacus subsp. salilacus]MBE1615811.1 hypothetical protein [Flavobacterium sp. SaA2.13]